MSSRWKVTEKGDGYYIFDTATQLYLSSQYEWNSRGARIPDLLSVKKVIRVLAERFEEARRPEGWEKLPHTYEDLVAAQFIPSSLVVTDGNKVILLQARDIATQFVIMVWKERVTN